MEINIDDYAVIGHNLSLNLGKNWKPVPIFNNLSIKVPKGAIYGLIGPSGCGKTSLQRCIFGFYKPQSGVLLVFGQTPKENGFAVPGPLVGFMPQDLALNEDLTIKEMLTFFGRLFDLDSKTINERIDELLKVIDIPWHKRRICNLSIGQRRRVSLAAALIHRPKLLLLDEPTVGSDPLLVHKMWNYLFYLRDTYKMTIIVTTHYLEEIVKADRFGLMRKRQIIVEDNPKQFIEASKEDSLEKAVFKFCHHWDEQKRLLGLKDVKGQIVSASKSSFNISPVSVPSLSSKKLRLIKTSPISSEPWEPLSNFTVLLILIWRLWLRCKRFMIYPIILTCLIIFIITGVFSVMFGRFPKDLRLGYLTQEVGDRVYSNEFLSILSENSVILRHETNEVESRKALELGSLDGYFIIGDNFGDSLKERITKGLSSLDSSGGLELVSNERNKIMLFIDASNRFKVDTIEIWMSRAVNKLSEKIQRDFNISLNSAQFFSVDPIYASAEASNIMASNEIVLIRYFLYAVEQFTIILLMSWTIKETYEKMNERLMACGIHRVQLVLSLLITSSAVIIPIYLLLFTLLIPTQGFPMRGSVVAVILSIISITICGVCKGILIGLITSDLIMAAFLHSAYCFSSLFLGYLLWPYESLPAFIKPLTSWFPFALAGDSLVWSLVKGKQLTDPLVYTNIVYSILFAIVSIVLLLFGFRKW